MTSKNVVLANWSPLEEETKEKPSSHNDSSFAPEQPNSEPKLLRAGKTQIRWRRGDDQRLFEALENYCRESGDTLEQIHSRAKSNPDIEFFWNIISSVIGWKGQLKPLVDRFVKLYSSDTLSTRENKLLRKLIRRRRKDPSIKWSSILSHFPGKSMEFIQSYAFTKKWIASAQDFQLDDSELIS
jgi:hypothetical protein